jgi:hypothetical protein
MFSFLRKKKPGKLADVFYNIYYKSGLWKMKETGSGVGSTLDHTKNIREQIPVVLKSVNAQWLLDAPCGDFNWMNHVALENIRYTGADIIGRMIEENKKKYPGKEFLVADITKDMLPPADVVLCRDCFIHLPNELIILAINNFKRSGIKYMLTNTYQFIQSNTDIKPGEFRMINLQLPPFSLPSPEIVIEEGFTDGFPDKKLALWKL